MRSITLDNALTTAGVPFVYGATKVNLTVNNRLLAATGVVGSLSIIDKKDFDITVTTGEGPDRPGGDIPEPATVVLMLCGASLALGLRRRGRG
jgi:hypothetical protein